MIREFVDVFNEHKDELGTKIDEEHLTYTALVKLLVKLLHDHLHDYSKPDPFRVTVIDDGDYQGNKLYIIGESCYQPSRYWSIFVPYGSCSHCDTIQSIWEEKDPEVRRKDYLTLALHMVQSMKQL